MTTDGPVPSGMKVRIIQSGKKTQPAELLVKGKGTMKWAMEKGNYTYQLQKGDQLQNNKFGCYTSFLFS